MMTYVAYFRSAHESKKKQVIGSRSLFGSSVVLLLR